MKCDYCNKETTTNEYGRSGSKGFTNNICLSCVCDLIYENVKRKK